MIQYPCKLYEVDQNNNIVQDLGNIYINVSNGVGTYPLNQTYRDLSATLSIFSNYMNIADFDSFIINLPYSSNDWSAWHTLLRQITPNLTVIGSYIDPVNNRLMVYNSSGYYALGGQYTSPTMHGIPDGMIQTWDIYDNNDNLMYSNVSPYWISLCDTTGLSWLIANDNDYSDGTIRYATVSATTNQGGKYTNISVLVKPSTTGTPLIQWLKQLNSTPESTDPYTPGGESDTGGGNGSFDDTTVPITIPSIPTISAVDTGFITLFNPTQAQLRALASYMWSASFDLTTLRKLFADPMDCILGLSIVPVAVPDGGLSQVTVGNNATGIQMIKAGAQYVSVDCGSININEFWGAYLDYSPYTKVDLYLPYIGTHAINTDDVMNKTIHVLYHVDILSGACTAFVECDGTVLYEFIGQCSSSIPITGKDWTNVINGVLGVAGSIGTMVATGGASAPMSVPVLASSAVNALKPNVEKSGSMSGTGGMMAVQVPYIIVTRPKQALPSGQNAMEGYPSYITRELGSLSGYTEVADIHLTGIPCTQQELDEIERLLGEGVYL